MAICSKLLIGWRYVLTLSINRLNIITVIGEFHLVNNCKLEPNFLLVQIFCSKCNMPWNANIFQVHMIAKIKMEFCGIYD